jgi:hypothetical protein
MATSVLAPSILHGRILVPSSPTVLSDDAHNHWRRQLAILVLPIAHLDLNGVSVLFAWLVMEFTINRGMMYVFSQAKSGITDV